MLLYRYIWGGICSAFWEGGISSWSLWYSKNRIRECKSTFLRFQKMRNREFEKFVLYRDFSVQACCLYG